MSWVGCSNVDQLSQKSDRIDPPTYDVTPIVQCEEMISRTKTSLE